MKEPHAAANQLKDVNYQGNLNTDTNPPIPEGVPRARQDAAPEGGQSHHSPLEGKLRAGPNIVLAINST
eukprot:2240689-Alexandrium_andersonii.AAC.1